MTQLSFEQFQQLLKEDTLTEYQINDLGKEVTSDWLKKEVVRDWASGDSSYDVANARVWNGSATHLFRRKLDRGEYDWVTIAPLAKDDIDLNGLAKMVEGGKWNNVANQLDINKVDSFMHGKGFKETRYKQGEYTLYFDN